MDTSTSHQTHRAAGRASVWIWFAVMTVIGLVITLIGARTDRFMYDSGAEVVDMNAVRSNFTAVSGMPSDTSDSRLDGDLAGARSALQSGQ